MMTLSIRNLARASALCILFSSTLALADKAPPLMLAVEGGVSTMNEGGPFGFSAGLGASTHRGFAWGIRLGTEVKRWLALDLHYVGMDNVAAAPQAPGGTIDLVTSALTAEVRFTLPMAFVQPYFFTGPGVYATTVVGSADAKMGTPFYDSAEFGIPLGVGLGVPLTRSVTLGGELTYHRLFGEKLADDDEIGGGDLTTFNMMLRVRL